MGIPVTFSEISNFAAIGEIAYQEGSLIPDLSFGTHFFQDLVEMDIFYIAVYPDQDGVFFNQPWFEKKRNILAELSPKDADYAHIVRVFDVKRENVKLIADLITQNLLCFIPPDAT